MDMYQEKMQISGTFNHMTHNHYHSTVNHTEIKQQFITYTQR